MTDYTITSQSSDQFPFQTNRVLRISVSTWHSVRLPTGAGSLQLKLEATCKSFLALSPAEYETLVLLKNLCAKDYRLRCLSRTFDLVLSTWWRGRFVCVRLRQEISVPLARCYLTDCVRCDEMTDLLGRPWRFRTATRFCQLFVFASAAVVGARCCADVQDSHRK